MMKSNLQKYTDVYTKLICEAKKQQKKYTKKADKKLVKETKSSKKKLVKETKKCDCKDEDCKCKSKDKKETCNECGDTPHTVQEMNDDIMKAAGFEQEVNDVHNKVCPFCKQPVQEDEFRDEISRKEFGISGLCQKCQDEMFGCENEETVQAEIAVDNTSDENGQNRIDTSKPATIGDDTGDKEIIKQAEFNDYDEDNEDDYEGDNGWSEDLIDTLEYPLSQLYDLQYELKNCVRGSYTGCKTQQELADKIIQYANDLIDAANSIKG